MNRFLYFVAGAHLCCDINMGALPALLPFFVTEYGMDYTSVAGLMFAASFFASILQPYFGYMADKASRHWFIPLGVLLSGCSFGLIAFTRNYWTIFGLVMLMGLGSAIFHPEAARFVNALSGQRRASGMSIFSLGGNGGFGFGPVLVALIVTGLGMRGLVIFAVVALLMSVTLFYKLPVLVAEIDRIKAASGVTAAAAKTAEAVGHPAEKRGSAMEGGKSAVPAAAAVSASAAEAAPANDWHSFGRLTALITFRSVVINIIMSFLPLFCVTVLAVSNGIAGTTLSVLSICGVVATMVGGALADRIGETKVLLYGSILLVPTVAAILFCPDILWVYLLMVPLSMAMNGTYSSFVVLGQTYLAKNIGFASGVTLGLSATVGGIAAPLLGWYADHHGIHAVMVLAVILAAGTAVSAFFLPNPRKQAE